MELFSITCTTCNARLTVRSKAAIGQILACPKCHSMVEIVPPAEWAPPTASGKAAIAKTAPRPSAAPRAAAAAGPLDSDFALPTQASTSEAAAAEVEASQPSVAISRAETIGKRAAVTVGLLAGLAVTLLILLRTDDGQELPIANAQQAAANSADDRAASENNDGDTLSIDQPAADEAQPPGDPITANEDSTVGSIEEEPSTPDESSVSVPVAEAALAATVNTKVGDLDRVEPPGIRPPTGALEQQAVASEPERASSLSDEPSALSSEITAEDRATAARLEERIRAIDFQQAKLSDVVEFLARMANVTLRFDPEALVAANVETTAPVTVQQTNTTVARALGAALDKLGLIHEIRDGQVVIVTRPEAPGPPRRSAVPSAATRGEDSKEANSADPQADLRLEAARP